METSPINRTSVSEQIFEQLKERIIRGDLKPGEKLPSEHALCKMYKVSRTTIRQALANLSSLNLIETRVGEGSFVHSFSGADIISPIMTQAYFCDQSLEELVELRGLIEPQIAEFACKKATAEDVKELERIFSLMEKQQNNLSEFAKLDCEFHTQIVRIGKNTYMIKMSEILSDILLSSFIDIVARRGKKAGLKYHKGILDTFRKKKPEEARRVMKEHMDDMLESIKKNNSHI